LFLPVEATGVLNQAVTNHAVIRTSGKPFRVLKYIFSGQLSDFPTEIGQLGREAITACRSPKVRTKSEHAISLFIGKSGS
jgi:hypothetical protein